MSGGAFSMRINLADLDSQLDADTEVIEAAARPAAQAGAQVFYDAAKANVRRLRKHTGNLDESIYQAFSRDNSGQGYATYHVSANAGKAPHAMLVEYGHLQRYASFKGADGRVHLMVRPEKQGTPKPGRRASQAEKDAYWVPLATPVQVAAKPFLRPAFDKADAALDAATEALFAQLEKRGVIE